MHHGLVSVANRYTPLPQRRDGQGCQDHTLQPHLKTNTEGCILAVGQLTIPREDAPVARY
jgi:hypothetical protein